MQRRLERRHGNTVEHLTGKGGEQQIRHGCPPCLKAGNPPAACWEQVVRNIAGTVSRSQLPRTDAVQPPLLSSVLHDPIFRQHGQLLP